MDTLAELQFRLAACPVRMRAGLARRLDGLRRRRAAGKPIDRGLAELTAALEAAVAACAERRAALPRPTFDDGLPVNGRRAQIAAAIRDHPVVVVCGETGSGKTTQLPKICLELGFGAAGLIGHTQPRRIAARSVAARIAEELGEPPGRHVGYKVRFSDHTGPECAVKLMTDGILLAETQGDPLLEAYEVLIVDEAHERSLNIDFLLGYLKRILPRRPDLKVVITSATIDPERFARHFDGAPVIEVSGRTYPVETRYRPLLAEDDDARDRDLQQAIVDAVDELWAEGPGDVLVFLAGEREIRETAEALRKHHPPGVEILPLFARLAAAEQNRVFQPHGRPRIVLATNVAETSLTVPGIRYVVDPGTARISRYSYRAKIQRLPVERISQASAAQRAGRCGRVQAGVCMRLYGEDDFAARPRFTEPEILRTNLAAVILQMAALNLGDPAEFPFVEPPDARLLNDGYQLLQELQAVDARRQLTPLGRELARLPLDPRLGRMVLAARDEGCVADVLVIASALALQDPRERPLDARQAADERHRRFRDERSDFLALLRLWDWWHAQARRLSKSKLRELARTNFLSFVRLREWHELHAQLAELVAGMGLKLEARVAAPPPPEPGQRRDEHPEAAPWPPNAAALHRALLTGLLGQVGLRQEDGAYLGARGRSFHVFPGSGLARKPPRWVMAAEIVETAKIYARTCARIEPEWIEPLAGHLLKRSYSEPHWEKRAAQVAAKERVTLYGLPVVVGRRVNYGPLDPALARQLFIRHALVERDFTCGAAFFHDNAALIAAIEALETKARRRDVLVDEEDLYRFYDARIPAGIYSGPAFFKWLKVAERDDPHVLHLTREVLMAHAAADVTDARFPDHLLLNGVAFPLEYRFEPGAADDGVTLVVPLAALNQVPAARCEWLVPGLLPERIAALLKSLPKTLRRHFVPVPDTVEQLMQALAPADRPLAEAMAAELTRSTGVPVPDDAWHADALPPHLAMNFRVVDPAGQVLGEGRDLPALRRTLGDAARTSFGALASALAAAGAQAPATRAGAPAPATGDRAAQRGPRTPAAVPADDPVARLERADVGDWDFGPLPDELTFVRNGVTLKGYPALVAEGERLALRVLDAPERAAAAHREGLRRLIALRAREPVKHLRRNLPGLAAMALHFVKAGTQEELREDLMGAIVDRAFLADGLPRERAAFERALEHGRGRLMAIANEVCAQVAQALASYHEIRKRIGGQVPLAWMEAVADIRGQLDALVHPGFVSATPAAALRRLPVYLKAVELRLQRLNGQLDKDRARRAEIQRLWNAYRQCAERQARRGGHDPELDHLRWMIEELRVSQFAQELRTAYPVSAKRVEEQLAKLRP
ncbi:ATP-dependent helicase HrpA [Plasticicumulans lactativorans]|uniref:ATP-dependent helicase HrpA n=1 Tax=Plasticicumulans lactativorans TaxID=1133106 RepID=A0A4R2LAD0_9GAMM|nr:ATP-dependent RNA helicase HrpA [Plasticicumulans lactativorans]TCO83169.1 ATP-dependent helicase HrpA [Plasticicumulans lactativorans]